MDYLIGAGIILAAGVTGVYLYHNAKPRVRQCILGCVDIYSSMSVRSKDAITTMVGSSLFRLDNFIDARYFAMLDRDGAFSTQKIISAVINGKNVTSAIKYYFSVEDTPSCSGVRLYFRSIRADIFSSNVIGADSSNVIAADSSSVMMTSDDTTSADLLHLIFDDCGDLYLARYNLTQCVEILSGSEVPFGDLTTLIGIKLPGN